MVVHACVWTALQHQFWARLFSQELQALRQLIRITKGDNSMVFLDIFLRSPVLGGEVRVGGLGTTWHIRCLEKSTTCPTIVLIRLLKEMIKHHANRFALKIWLSKKLLWPHQYVIWVRVSHVVAVLICGEPNDACLVPSSTVACTHRGALQA